MLARELHDRVAQTLTGMLVDLENFKTRQVEWEDVLKEVDTVQTSTRQVLASLRQLLHEMRGELGLSDFGGNLDDTITRFEQSTGIGVILESKEGWPKQLAPAASLNLLRIIDEALTNVRRHSGARTVHISLEPVTDRELALSIVDDGRGFDSAAAPIAGMGTTGMRERAMLFGGRLNIESGSGTGTAVVAVFPRGQLVYEEPAWTPPLMMAENASA